MQSIFTDAVLFYVQVLIERVTEFRAIIGLYIILSLMVTQGSEI
jgi:hypothetical protein